MIALIVVFSLLGVASAVGLVLVLWKWQHVESIWTSASFEDDVATLEVVNDVYEKHSKCLISLHDSLANHFFQTAQGIESLAKDALSSSVTQTQLAYQDELMNKILAFVASTQLLVERRLANRISLLTELFTPFWVSLTKKELPEKYAVQYLKVEEPVFDEQNEIDAAQKKLLEAVQARQENLILPLVSVGKLQFEPTEKASVIKPARRQEVLPILQRARFWAAILVPTLAVVLVVSVAVVAAITISG